MVTEMITLKLEDTFLHEIDALVAQTSFHSRTEFIRQALREKIEDQQQKEALRKIAHLKGVLKHETSDEELAGIREQVFASFEKKIK